MADTNECFSIGSMVMCETCFNEEIQGEVIAFDQSINMLTLKTKTNTGKSTCNINFVNLNYVSELKVLEDATGGPLPALPYLDLNKLSGRLKRSVEEKSKLLQAIKSGGTVSGQRLFLTIGKTIDQLTWSGSDIVVLDQVHIQSPYGVDNIKDVKDSNSKAVAHVRKIVDKFHKDQLAYNLNNGINNIESTQNATGGASIPKEVQPISQ